MYEENKFFFYIAKLLNHQLLTYWGVDTSSPEEMEEFERKRSEYLDEHVWNAPLKK